MNRQWVVFGGVPALAVAALMWLAAPAPAQHGGGGGHGGGHGGGGRGGGFGPGFHAGPGGFRGPAVAVRPYPGVYRGFHGGRFWGYPGFYGGFYLGYYGGGYYDNAYYFGPVAAYASNPAPAADYQAYYPPEAQAAVDPNTASLTVRVPADAEIWFDNTKMTQTGTVREYVTPPLTPDTDYSYQARARWTANGKVFDQTHQIHFKAGQAILVDFLTPPPGAGKQPAMDKAP